MHGMNRNSLNDLNGHHLAMQVYTPSRQACNFGTTTYLQLYKGTLLLPTALVRTASIGKRPLLISDAEAEYTSVPAPYPTKAQSLKIQCSLDTSKVIRVRSGKDDLRWEVEVPQLALQTCDECSIQVNPDKHSLEQTIQPQCRQATS